MRRAPRAGYSLVELAVAMTLLIVVFALPALLLDTSSRAYSTGSSAGEVDLASRRALETLARRLEFSALDRIPAAAAGPGVPFSTIDFQVVNGYVDGEATFGEVERIALQPEPGEADDGIDNDGDGLVDEQVLVWTRDVGLPNERSRVLCRRVRRALEGEVPANGVDDNGNGLVDEGGLTILFDGERVVLSLSVERRDAYGVNVLQTARRTVALRN
jgi:hypothetical protein